MNLALEALLLVSVLTGVGSWLVPLDRARPLTLLHAVSGFSMVLLVPMKVRGSVASGFRRGRPSRWFSAAFGILVMAAIVFGTVHSTGLWHGAGYWSALWVHLLFGFALILPALWHIGSRPVRTSRVDLSRRAVLSAGGLTAAATVAVGMQEGVLRLAGFDGSRRAGTGSYEIASFDPSAMPVVSWLDDKTPTDELDDWIVLVDGSPVSATELADAAAPVDAALDCTGGWRSTHRWEVVSLNAVLPDRAGRSVRVTSSTGYSRLFARSDCDGIYLCTGYDGRPLRRGHGAPLRIVAPGRRGPWWVKWITTIELSDRPAWLQSPFPTT